MSLRAGFAEESKEILPLVPAVATVALAAGVATPAVGLTSLQSAEMSIVVYFPSVVLATLDLSVSRVPGAVIMSLVVDICVVTLSFSIASFFSFLERAQSLDLTKEN